MLFWSYAILDVNIYRVGVTYLVSTTPSKSSFTCVNIMHSTAGDVCNVGLSTIMMLGIPILFTET